METRANYALIGAFTLAIVAAAFLFLFWFSGGSKQATLRTYQVIFTGSVSGLSRGSTVLFNGLRVGEVTEIDLMKEDPSRVSALIEVNGRTPVTEDTRAKLESQGLTGSAAISLIGGSATSKPLERARNATYRVIYANHSDLQNIIENVERISSKADIFLERANKLLDTSAASITQTVRNTEAMTQELASALHAIDPKKLAATVEGINRIVGSVDANRDGIGSILRSAPELLARLNSAAGSIDTVAKTLANSEHSIATLFTDGAAFASSLGGIKRRVDDVLTQTSGILEGVDPRKVAGIVDNIGRFANGLETSSGGVHTIVENAAKFSAKLEDVANRVTGVLDGAQGLVGSGQTRGAIGEIGDAAHAIRKLADNLDGRTRELTASFNKIAGAGLRDLQAFMTDGRRTLNDVNRTVRGINRNPQQFLLGNKSSIPEYSGN